jgi:hypothetical protein
MKRYLLAFVLTAAALHLPAQRKVCTVKGMLKLVPPYNGLVSNCQFNGKPKWEVGYSEPYQSIFVTDHLTKTSWLVPVSPEANYSGTDFLAGGLSFFFMQTGAYEDEHQIPVQLEGN